MALERTIRTINIGNKIPITDRDIDTDKFISSIDVNQVDGRIVVAYPYNDSSDGDGDIGGYIKIHPQDKFTDITTLQDFGDFGILGGPMDAKFDYIRQKIWIADTVNHRVFKLNSKNDVDIVVSDLFYYPHSIVISQNTGNAYIKCYVDPDLNYGAIYHVKQNGTEIDHFYFDVRNTVESSSSESEEFESSSSSGLFLPDLPLPNSMYYDHARSRLWWVSVSKVYMLDELNSAIQTYDISQNNFIDTHTVTVDLASGNAFIIATDVHNERYIIQISRDNNEFLARTYLRTP